ncbi:MAG: cyclic nucleotide-binding domain-containing protein [Mariprofundus sp.]|nr:cyclic nucleotide-binding domain-containing protein [Mariprofundus sp.]
MSNSKDLHNKALQALLAGNDAQALQLFIQLHEQQPDDLRLFTKVADLRRKMGDSAAAVKDYIDIANAYSATGYAVQAIAINKIILRIDPSNTFIMNNLQTLSEERDFGFDDDTFRPSIEKKDDPEENIHAGLSDTPLLSSMQGEQLNSFINSLQLRHINGGEKIYQAGDDGTYLYLIGMGEASLHTIDIQGQDKIFSRLTEGDFFGERAFMSRLTQTCDAVAETDCNLLLIDRATFDDWVEKFPEMSATVETFYRQRVLARILAMTPVFEGVPSYARAALADQFTLRSFDDGEMILQQGDIGDTFYLIRSGLVTLKVSNPLGETIFSKTIREGDFVGEVALLSGRPRTASIYAQGKVELMELSRSNFEQITEQYSSVKSVVEEYIRKRAQETITALRQQSKSS